MTKPYFGRLLTAMVTPFAEDGSVNYEAGCQLADWLLANGVLERDEHNSIANCAFIGPNDMRLAQTLIKSGPEHRKFLRQIMVCVDITAPLYW